MPTAPPSHRTPARTEAPLLTRPIPAPEPAPPLRHPELPLPDYRFVPRLYPHPYRGAGGHRHLAEGAEGWPHAQMIEHGCDLFDQRYVWESHECWERVWHQVDRADPVHPFLQGLIQAAAFCIKVHEEAWAPADRLLLRASEHLDRAEAAVGPVQHGVDLPRLRARLQSFRAGGEWPVIGLPEGGSHAGG